MNIEVFRKPAPKWNIYHQDGSGKFKAIFAYSDEELDLLIEQIDSEGGTILRVYARD